MKCRGCFQNETTCEYMLCAKCAGGDLNYEKLLEDAKEQ